MTVNQSVVAETEIVSFEAIQQRAIGAYLGLAVGDALGATVEFMTSAEIRVNYGTHDRMRGGGWLRLRPGQVTDDTTMSLALGRSILESKTIDAGSAAEAFSDWMRSKPVDIGHTVRHAIIHYRKTGVPCVESNEYSAGNGACMRCLPVALATLGQEDCDIYAASCSQAHVTHNNPLSDAATMCIITMIQRGLRGATMNELYQEIALPFVSEQPLFAFEGKRFDNPSAYIVETLRTVFQSLFFTASFQDCLIDVVNRGGDADTTGAICGMVAGSVYGVESIPNKWLKGLDSRINRECTQQACDLLQLALARQPMG